MLNWKEHMTEPHQYKNCIVAFLDILGFKELVNTAECDEIINIFDSILTPQEGDIALHRATDDEAGADVNYNNALQNADIYVMSDSIVVAAEDIPEGLAVVVDICDVIQEQLFDQDSPVFVRGAISHGDFYCGGLRGLGGSSVPEESSSNLRDSGGSIAFGKGLVEAYLAQENYAIYPRIILTEDITDGRIYSLDYNKWAVDRKDGYYYIDTYERYFGNLETDENNEITNEKYKRLKDYAHSYIRTYSDPRVREKYLWVERKLEEMRRDVLLEKGILMEM